eukprot:scaffold453610_cov36-Prasinocladus_malaysianus.AAC.1
MASDLVDVNRLSWQLTIMRVFASIAIMLAIARLIYVWAFHPRVRVITGTLQRAAPTLVPYIFASAIVLVLVAVWGHFLFGSQFEDFASIHDSFG